MKAAVTEVLMPMNIKGFVNPLLVADSSYRKQHTAAIVRSSSWTVDRINKRLKLAVRRTWGRLNFNRPRHLKFNLPR
jgi:hypothetical protein